MGFKLSTIIEYENFYLVEGDIMISKNNLINTVTSRHAYTNSIVDIDKVTNMTLKVDSSVPESSGWSTAVMQAIIEWNNIENCKIKFTMIPTNSTDNAYIYIASDFGFLPNTTALSAAIPSNGNPGTQVKINLDYPNLANMPTTAKKRAIMHELGHIVGFLHTDGVANPTGAGNNIIPTTSGLADPNSIMNSFLTTAIGFSPDDLIASKYLYPGEGIVGTQAYSINIDNLNYRINMGVKTSTNSYIKIIIHYESGAPEVIYNRLIKAEGNNAINENVFNAVRLRKPLYIECDAFVNFRSGTDANSSISQSFVSIPSSGIFSGYYSPRMTDITFNYSVELN